MTDINDQKNSDVPNPSNKDSKRDDSIDSVSYESHRKLLNEYKQNKSVLEDIQAKYSELTKRLEAEEEAKLKEQQKWREIAEKKEKELKNAAEQIQFLNKKHQNKIKEDHFKKALGADLKRAFMAHVDLDSIAINEQTGEVDEMTLQNVLEQFKEEFPELVPSEKEDPKPAESRFKLPQKNPKGKTSISSQDLKGLSVKELKELYAEVLHT